MERPVSLTIKHFKKIKGPVEFREIDAVNFIVGRNGSGKTSILEAIQALDNGGQASKSISGDGFVEMRSHEIGKRIEYSAINRTFDIQTDGGLILRVHRFQHDIFDYALNKERLGFLNETHLQFGEATIEAKKVMNMDDPFDRSDSETLFFQNGTRVVPELMADGIMALNELRYFLDKIVTEINSTKGGNAHLHIALIDEPENYLHPAFQKAIPEMLDSTILRLIHECRNKFCFFVSTHSPFIISQSASFENQKVFLIEQGEFKELNGSHVSSSFGYHGRIASKIVGEMLGASVTDLGYPENFVIVEEYSLQVILQFLQDKKLIKPVQFISCAGTPRLERMLTSLENLDTLIKCNPFYSETYQVVIDNYQKMNDKAKARIDKIKQRLANRFLELKREAIEDYYSNVDNDIHLAFMQEVSKTTNFEEKGQIKGKYARAVAEMISTKELFSRLFDNELDLLLA